MFKSRLLSGKMNAKQMARFERKMCPEAITGCWLWIGLKTVDNYPIFSWRFTGHTKNASVPTHRVSYMHWNGDVPEGMTVHHKCENTLCVNPEHLEVLSVRDNILRSPTHLASREAAQTVCKYGHKFDRVTSAGKRYCKTCEKIRTARRWRKEATGPQEEKTE